MKLGVENRTKRKSRGFDILPQSGEETRKAPSELLTPEVRKGILEIKHGYEGGMLGDQIPSYVSFLATARRCWPELKDELKMTGPLGAEARGRIPGSMNALLEGEGDNKSAANYGRSLVYLYKMTFLDPLAVRSVVKRHKDVLLSLVKKELNLGRYAYALELASILELGIPESRAAIDEIFGDQSADLAKFVSKSRVWAIGGLAKLLITNFTLDIPTEEWGRIFIENQAELSRLAQERNYGETQRLEQRMDTIFGLGVLLADEAKLQADGTIQYAYSKKLGNKDSLPDRSLV